jgi:hypothetical protein
MTEEAAALKCVLLVPGTIEGEHVRLTLEQGGCKKVLDLKKSLLKNPILSRFIKIAAAEALQELLPGC